MLSLLNASVKCNFNIFLPSWLECTLKIPEGNICSSLLWTWLGSLGAIYKTGWPSGLRRWIKAPISSGAWVRIPLQSNLFGHYPDDLNEYLWYCAKIWFQNDLGTRNDFVFLVFLNSALWSFNKRLSYCLWCFSL